MERDEIISIRDGAPRPMAAQTFPGVRRPVRRRSRRSVIAKLPNDPIFYEQYWPANMIDLPRAWTITTGSPNVIVASVDMGIRFDHPDIGAESHERRLRFRVADRFRHAGRVLRRHDLHVDRQATATDPTPIRPIRTTSSSTISSDAGITARSAITACGPRESSARSATTALAWPALHWTVKIRPIRVLDITGSGFNFDIAQGVLYAAGLPATGADARVGAGAKPRANHQHESRRTVARARRCGTR